MSTHEQTAAELIAVCLDTGSESAWLQLVGRFQPLIASVVMRIVRRYDHPNRNIVDDLVQETFLRLCREDCKALREFHHVHEAAIFGYVKVVAGSVVNDYFRALNAQKRAGEVAVDPEILGSFAASTGASAEDSLLLREVESCLESITENKRDREVFWRYYRQGLTAVEIAALPGMDLSAKGIESCLLRLLKSLRRQMSPPTGKPEGFQRPSTLGEIR
jgi:RNA polymerase sigma-70 factor (ECF subfamily)